MSTGAGESHEVSWLPAAFPTGTRPTAIAPTAVPSANGVSTEETANRFSAARDESATPRSAYAAPRQPGIRPHPAQHEGDGNVSHPKPPAKAKQATVSAPAAAR